MVWDTLCFPKHRVIGLLAVQNRLPTIDNLCKRGLVLVNRCALCESSLETISHLFFRCSYSAMVWQAIAFWLHILPEVRLSQLLHWYKTRNRGRSQLKRQRRCALMCALYLLWQERNKRIFKGASTPPVSLIKKIKFLVLLSPS
ncbi:uncharacterized protein LOC141601149 [Silene latifolia]|uniref:uncharacterized protein LOC141601149 n=1 Tax=Silene latifolia TaxID=37657 RepID=UPI003D7738E7